MRWGRFNFAILKKRFSRPRFLSLPKKFLSQPQFPREKLHFSMRRIKKPFFKKILLLLGIILLSLGIYRIFTSYFRVKTIKIADTKGEILKGIEKLGGQHLLFLNKVKWEEEIKKENPILKNIEIQKKFPDQVLVKFERREPKAAIFNPFSQNYFLIDEEGVILKQEKENEKLPVIIASLQNFQIGDRIKNKSIDFDLDIILLLGEEGLGSKFELDQSSKNLKVTLANDVLIFVSLKKEKEETIYSLQMLVKKFKIEGSWPKKVDLRFAKPILTF